MVKCLKYDRFLKVIDISGNKFTTESLKELVKYALKENATLISLDITNSPGCTEKLRKQVALCLLKNIDQMNRSGIEVKSEWIRPDILTFKIPNRIIEALGIAKLAEKRKSTSKNRGNVSGINNTFEMSMSNSNSRSPTSRKRVKSQSNSNTI
jgi:hypothetical protein